MRVCFTTPFSSRSSHGTFAASLQARRLRPGTPFVVQSLIQLAKGGMWMMVVTHDKGFARRAANGVVLMDEGRTVEQAEPETVFTHPPSDLVKDFVSKIPTQ